MNKLKPKYSGDLSKPFWNMVNKLPAHARGELYSLGVALQNLEGQVLKRLGEEVEASKDLELIEDGMDLFNFVSDRVIFSGEEEREEVAIRMTGYGLELFMKGKNTPKGTLKWQRTSLMR